MAEQWGCHPADVRARTTVREYEHWRELQLAKQPRRTFAAGGWSDGAANGHVTYRELD